MPRAGAQAKLAAASLEAGQELHEIAAEIVTEIAAFLDQHRRQAEARDLAGHGMKARAGYFQALQRIAFAGVEAQRHDQRGRCEFADACQRLVARLEPRRVGRAQRQRQVEVAALALAGAGLVRVAPEVGIVEAGIGVDRHGEHVVALEEDALRAVAVMDVDVEHGDAGVLAAQMLGGDGGVVQEAEAARHVGIGVMARRPAERIGLARARQDRFGRGGRDLGRGECCVPGARTDRAAGVDLMPAGAADQALRIGRRIARRMHVGHDFRSGARQLRPFARGDLQEVDVFGRVDRLHGGEPERFGRRDLVAGVAGGGQQPRRAFGLLGALLDDPAHQEGLRIVLRVLVGIDDLHGVAMALASRRDAISASLKPTSRMISTVCSPTPGDFSRVSTGASESLMGLPADFTGPMPG